MPFLGISAAGWVAIAGLAAGGVSSDKAQQAQTKARRQQRATLAKQEAQQDLSIRQQRTQVRRRGRAARAEALVVAQGQTGGVAGSGAQGAVGSIASQTGANVGFLAQQQALSREVTRSRQATVDFKSSASYYGSLADLSFGVSTEAGGFKEIFK